MNNIMTIIKKELARFFGDRRLVFTTVIMPGLLIYLMYTLMGEGMMKQLTTADDYVAKAYAVNMPEDIKMMASSLRMEWEDWDGNPADKERVLKEIEEGEKDLLVYFPENFMADVEAYNMENKAPNVELYYNSEKSNSQMAYQMM